MGPAETAGIVVITVAIIQGLLKLVEHLINKYSDRAEDIKDDHVLAALARIEAKIGIECGLSDRQARQLTDLHEMHSHRDMDGIPLWYVPRSWSETQKEIVDRLQKITETEYKMLAIIERLERRLELLDNRSQD